MKLSGNVEILFHIPKFEYMTKKNEARSLEDVLLNSGLCVPDTNNFKSKLRQVSDADLVCLV